MDYDDDTSSTMSVDDLTYSTLFNDEVVDNGERHAGLNSCDTGLETCDELKPTRHGNELLNNSIQSAIERGDSDIDKIAYLPGDDTGGTGHTQVYESSNNMLDSKSISENQSESDMDLVEDISSDYEIYSDTDDGEYFLAVESLEETLEIEPHCNPLQPTAKHPVHIQCTHYSSHYIFSAHTTAAITSSVHTAAMYSHIQLSAANLQCTLQLCTAICSQSSVHTAANCSHLQPPTLQLYHSVHTAASLSDANTIQCI